jgi:hypothetical protein
VAHLIYRKDKSSKNNEAKNPVKSSKKEELAQKALKRKQQRRK